MNRHSISKSSIGKAAKKIAPLISGFKSGENQLVIDSITEAYRYPMSKNRLSQILEDEFGWDQELMDLSALSKMDELVREAHSAEGESDTTITVKPDLKRGMSVFCISKNAHGKIKELPTDEIPDRYLLEQENDEDETSVEFNAPFKDIIPQ
jgi:hypothetical protein